MLAALAGPLGYALGAAPARPHALVAPRGGAAAQMAVRAPVQVNSALPQLTEGFDLAGHLEWTERTLLTRAIEQTGGDLREMCRVTGLERNRLRYKLNKFELIGRTR